MRSCSIGIPGLFCVLCFGAACSAAPPQDLGVQAVLDRLGHSYTIDAEGDFLVQMPLPRDRRQGVWVRSTLNSFQGPPVREVFTVAAEFPESLPRNLANNLLLDNYRNRVLGSWSLIHAEESDRWLLAFLAKVDHRPGSPWLEAALREAAEAGDEMERLLSGAADRY